VELAEHKILCNNIAPGAIATPINQKVLDDPEAMKLATAPIPLARFGTTVEVAALAVYLASDESTYTTGATFVVDGGLTQNVTKY
jgi:glucose 1-dehydrogenase